MSAYALKMPAIQSAFVDIALFLERNSRRASRDRKRPCHPWRRPDAASQQTR